MIKEKLEAVSMRLSRKDKNLLKELAQDYDIEMSTLLRYMISYIDKERPIFTIYPFNIKEPK